LGAFWDKDKEAEKCGVAGVVFEINYQQRGKFILKEYKKNSPKNGLFHSKKIVVRLAESVYRFYEPFIFRNVNISNNQGDYG
jgi:hypothetical protein